MTDSMNENQSQFKAICEKADLRATYVKNVVMVALNSSGYPTDDEAMVLVKYINMGHISKIEDDYARDLIAFTKARIDLGIEF
ncbi:MAG: hypothetical protein OEQ39_00210 [Gammaproteobacteria bacterium]|nr:hypothetical protein [Gammaproteobacteria bacterium]